MRAAEWLSCMKMVWLLAALVPCVSAATISVTCCAPLDIQAAVTGATDGDVIQLDPGVEYFGACGTGLTLGGASKRLTLDGRGSTLSCWYSTGIALVSESGDTIMNLKVNSSYGYTGVSMVSSTSVVFNCVQILGRGIGMVVNSSTPLITGSIFKNNNASFGSAMRIDVGANVNIINCTFQSNWALGTTTSFRGAAINVASGTTVTIVGSQFLDNTAYQAGAINVQGTASISNSTFSRNSALNAGGAMSVAGTLTSTQNVFSFNKALVSTGGVLLTVSPAVISDINSQFTSNSAAGTGNGGGALFIAASTTVSFNNSVFASNTAAGQGGAATVAGKAYFYSCQFTSNTAADNGGALATNGAQSASYLSDAVFTRNSGAAGGGFYVTGNNAQVTIDGGTFLYNTATNRGVGYIDVGSPAPTAKITNVYVGYNTASNLCYGIGVGVGTLQVTNGTFIGNSGFQGGVILANSGSSIRVSNSYLLDNIITSTSVTGSAYYGGSTSSTVFVNSVFGLTTPQTDTVQQQAMSAILTAKLTVTGCTFSGFPFAVRGSGDSTGAIINSTFTNNGHAFTHASTAAWTVNNSTFRNNVEGPINTPFAGAISVSGAPTASTFLVTVSNSIFENNSGKNGGGIWASATTAFSKVTVTNCTFNNNLSGTRGAGININAGLATISGCTFTGNTVTENTLSSGGAIAVVQVSLATAVSISGCTFRTNKALLGGGIGQTVATTLSAVTISGCAFIKNTATSNGGAVNVVMGAISNSIFTQNTAKDGGGLYSSSLTNVTSVTNTYFFTNRGSGNGGAAALSNGVLTNCNVTSNSANAGGGVSSNINGLTTIDTCNITHNQATTNGGGVAGGLAGTLILTNAFVQYNAAGSLGGGVFSHFVATKFRLERTPVLNNTATQSGGGIYVALGTYDSNVTQSEISGNRAEVSGGGLAITGQTTVQLCYVHHNSAGSGGGIFTSDVSVVEASTITRNTALSGAGIACSACTLSLTAATTITDNAGRDEAGGLACGIGSGIEQADADVVLRNNEPTASPIYADCQDCGCCAPPAYAILNQTDDCVLAPGLSCSYYCPDGYVVANISGVVLAEMSCDIYGTLTPSQPCTPVSCDVIPSPANGTAVSVENPATGDRTYFTCDFGYGLVGNTSVYCFGPDWRGVIPHCQPIPCLALPAPANGTVSQGDAAFGDTVTFTCSPGFSLRGNPSLTCGQNGWSDTAPVCDPVPCGNLVAPVNGTISIPARPSSGSKAYFACDDGYGIAGSDNSTCLLGAWTTPSPTCDPLPCTDVVALTDHVQLLTPSAVTGEHIAFACDEGFYMIGEPTRLCLAPSYTGESPTCSAIFCNATETPIPNLISNCTTTVGYEVTCGFTCPIGTGGEPFETLCTNTSAIPSGDFVPAIVPCAACTAGTFSPDTTGVCRACPNGGTTLNVGSITQTDCLCSAGFYEEHYGEGDCIECPAGGFCIGKKERPVAAAGFYSNGEASFIACFPADACTGGDKCAKEYDGEFCGTCAEGYYRLNGLCYICPNNNDFRIAVIVIALFIIVCFTLRLVRPSDVSARTYGFVSISIGTAFVQIVATFADIRISWPQTTQGLFDAASAVNLNIEVAAPECIVNLTFYQKMQIQILLPLAFIAMLAVVLILMGIVERIRGCFSKGTHWGAYLLRSFTQAVAAFTMLLNFSYLFLARASLRQFACTQANGRWVVADAQTVECYTQEWRQNAVLCGFGLGVYVFGIPAIIHLVYYVHLKKYGQFAAAASYFSHFLVFKYTPRTWAWEILVMARKLLMVVFAIFWKNDTNAQISLSFAVLLLAMIVTLPMSPYRWRKHNIADGVCLFSSLAVLFSGILVANADNKAAVVNVVTVTVVAIALFVLFVVFLLEIKIWYNAYRLRKNINEERVHVEAAENIVAVMPSKVSVITVSSSGTLQEWVEDDMTLQRTFETGIKATLALRRGRIVFIADAEGIVAVSADRHVDRAYHKEPNVTAMVLSAQYLISGNAAGDVAFWPFHVEASNEDSEDSEDMKGETTHNLHVQLQKPHRMDGMHTHVAAMKRVGLFLYTVGNEGRVRKWNVQKRECFYTVQYHMSPGTSVTALTEKGSTLIIGFSNGTIKYITNVTVVEQRVQIKAITALALDDETLVTASADGTVVALSLRGGHYLQTLIKSDFPIGHMALDAAGAVVWADSSGALWRVKMDSRWNVRDPDPNLFVALLRLFICKCCVNSRQLVDSESGDAPEERLYHQLDLLSQSLLFPDNVPWKRIGPESADVIAGALATEVSQQQNMQGGLRGGMHVSATSASGKSASGGRSRSRSSDAAGGSLSKSGSGSGSGGPSRDVSASAELSSVE